MAKKSNEGILYVVLAILTAALIAWVWSKSKSVSLAALKASTAAQSASVPVQTIDTTDVLIAPADMGSILTNTSAPL